MQKLREHQPVTIDPRMAEIVRKNLDTVHDHGGGGCHEKKIQKDFVPFCRRNGYV